jgi:transcriptional regulator with XRE-family HTH domain
MAEPCNVAFGRYLKALRERRGLSLDEVQSLSQVFPEPIGKTYLSRCENGKQKLAFSKMIPLSRIYEVPPEVLVERMELDLELDRIGGPDTEGLGFRALGLKGRAASAKGHFWQAYGFLRDAEPLALKSDLTGGAKTPAEQLLYAIMSCSIVAARLGAQRLSLYELEHVRDTAKFSDERLANLDILLSNRFRERGEVERAILFAESALTRARSSGSLDQEAFATANMAVLMQDAQRGDEAIELAKSSFDLFKRAGLMNECTRSLINLADYYFEAARFASAKRALGAAERLAVKHGLDRPRALIRILRGMIAKEEGQLQLAVGYWRESIELSKKTRDRVTRFKAEFQLLKHALETGDEKTARALCRLMHKRALWIPNDVVELSEFRTLTTARP